MGTSNFRSKFPRRAIELVRDQLLSLRIFDTEIGMMLPHDGEMLMTM